jgi:di/tricarboxylate transporter
LTIAGRSEGRLTVVLMVTVAILSSIMSDTGTVAVLLPAIVMMARSARISPSKLLIPLSFGALLGGATTLIGTPPNIIVSDLLREQGQETFNFFSFTPMGVILIIVGVSYMLVLGRRFLPEHASPVDSQRVETPEELVALYRLPDNLFRLRVRRSSPLVGEPLSDSNLRERFNLTVLEVQRGEEPRGRFSLTEPMASIRNNQSKGFHPSGDTKLAVDDILLVQGGSTDVTQAAAVLELAVRPARESEEEGLITDEAGIAELLLPPRSSLIGKTLVEAHFGSRYHLTVLAIHRPGHEGSLDLKSTALRFGDSLLVQGPWKNIQALRDLRRDFVVTGQPEAMLATRTRRKAWVAGMILALMVLLMITNLVSIVTASLIAALLMVLSGCLSMDDAYQAVDWRSILLVAGMLPMSLALEKVDLVNLVAQWLTDILGPLGPGAVLAGLFLITSLFTQVLSNTATTVLVAPLALASASEIGVQPQAFLMAVAIAASMAFASPVASPVNTLVMSSGHYRFGDYIRVGLPLIGLLLIVAVIALPLIWHY